MIPNLQRLQSACRRAHIEVVYAAVENMMKTHKTDMRTAALIIGVKRVADATIRRGIFP